MLRAERIAAAAAGSRGGKQEKERAEPPRRSGRQTQQVCSRSGRVCSMHIALNC